MDEYINRGTILTRVDEIMETNHLRPDHVWFTPNGVKALAKDIPAADVVEVRHGRWRKAMGDSGVMRMACTNCCFYRFPENNVREQMFNYCPRCGAIMDGGQDDG